MKLPGKVLIIGGGIAGMCAAIELRKRGAHVDVVEIDPRWRVYGAGITLSGPTLRAFMQVGVIDDLMAHGWCADGLDVCLPDGTPVAEIQTPRIARADIPGSGGILRPELARILREHTLASGTSVRCGVTFSAMQQDGERVAVRFTDGREDSYTLVIGADGLQSKVRELIFPEAPKPHYTGQGSWRAVVPRGDVTRAFMCVGKKVKAGINPVSREEAYVYVTERRDSLDHIDESRWPQTLREVLAEFGGRVGAARDSLDEHSRVLFRPFYALLLQQPWHRGRIALIGDAVHATTPHLASGAGIGVEDAVVLAQELERADSLDPALVAFTARRFERCRMVVETSLRLGELERDDAPKAVHEKIMRDAMAALMAPI